jgi:predicted nucleic acid-binding protein
VAEAAGPTTFFVDTNVVIYSVIACPYQSACLELMHAIARGTARGYLSTATLEEVWHLELSGKAGSVDGLTHHAHKVFSPLLPVTDEAFQLALSLKASRLGSNDRLHAGTCAAHGITTICTADAAFDTVPGLTRVDPLDQEAVRRLLGQ